MPDEGSLRTKDLAVAEVWGKEKKDGCVKKI